MNKTYEIKGYTVEAVESVESDTEFKEFDLYIEGELVGNISRYAGEKKWTSWSEEGEELGTRAEIKAAVGLVIRDWEGA